MSLLNTIRYKF